MRNWGSPTSALAVACALAFAINASGATGQPGLESGQFSLAVRTGKFIVRLGETDMVTVQVGNDGPAGRGELTLFVEGGLGARRRLGSKTLTLPAQSSLESTSATFDYTASGDEGGRCLQAEFVPTAERSQEVHASVPGEAIPSGTNPGSSHAVGSEYIIVTDNPLRMSHLYFAGGAVMGDAWSRTPQQLDAQYRGFVRRNARDSYCGIYEVPFWAPDDFAALAPEQEVWRSGQTYAVMYKPALLTQIDEVHREGMWTLFYANTFVFGPYGFDLARKHPDWFQWNENWYGGTFNSSVLSKGRWELPDALRPAPKVTAPGQPATWNAFPHNFVPPALQSISPLVTKPEVAAYHNDQVAKSLRMFGWDGVRYDNNGWNVWENLSTDNFGHRVIPVGADLDALGGGLVRGQRAQMEKIQPHFVFGDNGAGLAPGLTIKSAADVAVAPKKWLAGAEHGGLVMEESFNAWMHSGATFDAMRDTLYRGCRGTRLAGGYPYVIGPLLTGQNNSPTDAKIVTALALASGAHLCASSAGAPDNLKPYLQMTTRYAELFYSDSLGWLNGPSAPFSIRSPRKLWWEEYQRVLVRKDLGRRYVVHLINVPEHNNFDALRQVDGANPQSGERVAANDGSGRWALSPLVQQNVEVTMRVPAGINIDSAWALSADAGRPTAQRLQAVRRGNSVSVVVPRVELWTVVVFDGVTKR